MQQGVREVREVRHLLGHIPLPEERAVVAAAPQTLTTMLFHSQFLLGHIWRRVVWEELIMEALPETAVETVAVLLPLAAR
jgi:hypothetical protein